MDIEILKEDAANGYSEAQFLLGKYYYEDCGDKVKAAEYFKEAAINQHSTAQYMLGLCLFNGEGVSQDQSEAVFWFKEAAKHYNEKAEYMLGICYLKGYGVDKNLTKAKDYLIKAKVKGHYAAEIILEKEFKEEKVSKNNKEQKEITYDQVVSLLRAQGKIRRPIRGGVSIKKDTGIKVAAAWKNKRTEDGGISPLQGGVSINKIAGKGVAARIDKKPKGKSRFGQCARKLTRDNKPKK